MPRWLAAALAACCCLGSAHAATCANNWNAQQPVSCSYCGLSNPDGNTYVQYSGSDISTSFTYDPVGQQWVNNLNTQSGSYSIEGAESSAFQDCSSPQSVTVEALLAGGQTPNVAYMTQAPGGFSCRLCQYHNDPFYNATCENPLPLAINNIVRSPEFRAMFGPCFDTAPSALMKCVQHAALYPPQYVGYYYYPLQQSWPLPLLQTYIEGAQPYPVHAFFDSSAATSNAQAASGPGATLYPTNYGLGRSAVEDDINSYIVYNTSNPTHVDWTLTNAFRAPFLNGGYPKWAQHFCVPGCHRGTYYSEVNVVAADLVNRSDLSYLRRLIGSSQPWVVRCTNCSLPGAVAYSWNAAQGPSVPEGPDDLRTNVLAQYCYTWFGGIPSMITRSDGTVGFNLTTAYRPNYVIPYASLEYNMDQKACPVNTYSRVCAHARRYYYLQSLLPGVSAAQKAALLANYSCAPCPANWTTGGATGAWFCLPPPGNVFVLAYVLNSTGRQTGRAWASRDLWQTELECGYTPAHCLQCAAFGMPGGLPSDFNEQIFFSVLLETRTCAANMYCPDSFTELPCPAATPYSPGGVASASQCGCLRGTFGPTAAGVCSPCRNSSSCPLGTYLPVACLTTDGQTADQACSACPNIPASNRTLLPVSLAFANGGGGGVCSFACSPGFVMQQLSPDAGSCYSGYACAPVGIVRVKSSGAAIYSPSAASYIDSFDASQCGIGAPLKPYLTNFVADGVGGASSSWFPTSPYCLCPQAPLCYSNRSFWYSLYSDVTCAPCPNPSAPTGAQLTGAANDVTLGEAAACGAVYCPTTGFYLNATAWQCQSCTARAAAVCPPGRPNIQGMGCLGTARPFNATNPAADCIACKYNTSSVGAGQFLNLNLVECAIQACAAAPFPAASYWSTTVCGGTTDYNWTRCTPEAACAAVVGMYVSTRCSTASDTRCSPCTVPGPGSYVPPGLGCSNGQTTDATVAPCPRGSYCPGGNSTPHACPYGHDSQPGAVSSADCYCALGTADNGFAGCVPVTCAANASTAATTPGPLAWASPQYMALDLTHRPVTRCYNCSSTPGAPSASFSRGGGLTLDSCACPAGYYGTVAGGAALACTPCPQRACAAPQSLGPDVCWTGSSRSAPTCGCQNPPFGHWTPGSATCSAFTCDDPAFQPVPLPQGTTPGSAGSTGSAMYAAKGAAWTRFMQAPTDLNQYINPCPPAPLRVTALAVTNYGDDAQHVVGEAQFAVWAVYGLAFVFMTQVYPMVDSNGIPMSLQYAIPGNNFEANPSMYNRWIFWYPGDQSGYGAGSLPTVAGLRVGAWGMSGGVSTRVAGVGAVVLWPAYGTVNPLLTLYARSMNTNLAVSADSVWGQDSQALAPFSLVSLPDLTFVAVATAQAIPGVSQPPSVVSDVFYVAYNKGGACGGVVYVAPWWSQQSRTAIPSLGGVCADNPAAAISAFGVRASPVAGVTVYIAYDGSSTLYAIPLQAAAAFPSPLSAVQSRYAFLSTQPGSPVLQGPVTQIFNVTVSAIVVGVGNSSGACPDGSDGCVATADALQRTLTGVQGMPWGTDPALPSPDTGAVIGVAGMATSITTGVLVAAYNDSLYVIDVSLCAPQSTGLPTYYDGNDHASGDAAGQTCVQHQCVRTRVCGDNQHTVNTYQCQCNDGYYLPPGTTVCAICPSGSFCTGGVRTACKDVLPLSTVTTAGATSINSCACQPGWFWQSFTGTCTACPATGWCPNGWVVRPCPNSRAPTATAYNAFPYACLCQAGYTGPACTPCPAGFVCPVVTTNPPTVYNSVSVLTITPQPGFTLAAATALVQQLLLPFLQGLVSQGTTSLGYIAAAPALAQRMSVEYVPATNHSTALLSVMLQFDISLHATQAHAWINVLTGALSCPQATAPLFCIVSVSPAGFPSVNPVANNTAKACPAGQSPAATMDVCECAAGYQTGSSSAAPCTACPAGTFKAAQGAGLCAACPVGSTAAAGSAQCTPAATPPPSQAAAGGLSTAAIIGIAAGGGVLVVGLGVAFALWGH